VQIQWTCPFDGKFIAALSWEAYRQRLSINSGHVGRAPPGTDWHRPLPPAVLDQETVYIPYHREYFADFQLPQMACGPVEGRLVCVSKEKATPLLRELLRRAEAR